MKIITLLIIIHKLLGSFSLSQYYHSLVADYLNACYGKDGRCGGRLPGLKSQFGHLLPLCPWAEYLLSLCSVSLSIRCKLKGTFSQNCQTTTWVKIHKALTTVPVTQWKPGNSGSRYCYCCYYFKILPFSANSSALECLLQQPWACEAAYQAWFQHWDSRCWRQDPASLGSQPQRSKRCSYSAMHSGEYQAAASPDGLSKNYKLKQQWNAFHTYKGEV